MTLDPKYEVGMIGAVDKLELMEKITLFVDLATKANNVIKSIKVTKLEPEGMPQRPTFYIAKILYHQEFLN